MFKRSDDPALQAAIVVLIAMVAIALFSMAAIVVIPVALAFGGYKLYQHLKPLPVYVPEPDPPPEPVITHEDLRQHCAVFGPSGHGKTQLLLGLIAGEIEQGTPMFIIDSTGAIMKKLERLQYFVDNFERLVILDPTDTNPPALNFFQFPEHGLSDARKDELFIYLFKAIDRELTKKQQTTIPYLTKLMKVIPDATLETLLNVLSEPIGKNGMHDSAFRDYVTQLDTLSQTFFRNQFYNRAEMQQTRAQIASRLFLLLGNERFKAMFTAQENKFDALKAIEERQVVVINTAQNTLGDDGSSIFGRFIIAQCRAAAFAREKLPEPRRHLALLIVDEASEYFDDTTERILAQTRQFGLGLVIATQNIEQMPPEVRHAVFGNTRIKIAGALSAQDAGALAREMHVEARDIQTLNPMEWVVHVRGRKPTLLKQTYGVIDQFVRNAHDDHSNLRELNRRLYGATARDTPNTAEPAATPQATKAEEEAPSLSDIELVITTARRLETLLETHYAASGRGLHEKITSVETQLPPHVIHAGRYVTTMRNQVVHVDAFSLPDRDWFVRCAQLFEDHFTPAATTNRIRSTPEPAAAPPHETERRDTAASRLEYDTDI